MAGQRDFITTPKKISTELTYSQRQLYKYIKRWFEERHYAVVELEYVERITPDNKKVFNFAWYTEKRAETYTKQCIELSFNAEVENVDVELDNGKRRTAQKGVVTVGIQGYIFKDTANDWALTKERPMRRLTRELFDKFVAKGKYAQIEAQLKKDIRAILGDLKTYFRTHRYD
jgi:hypothetical protein